MNAEQRVSSSQRALEIHAPARPPAPAVIIVHEYWGLNDDIRSIARRFADAGYLAAAIDLFDGQSTTDPQEGQRLARELDTNAALRLVEGAVQTLQGDERCTGRVGIVGFCLGGAMALAAAGRVPGLQAAVAFYGSPKDEYVDWKNVRVPVLGHYGAHDRFIPASRPQSIADIINAHGGAMEVYFYEAGHAFMREADPHVYVPQAAALGWDRTLQFFALHLGGRSDEGAISG